MLVTRISNPSFPLIDDTTLREWLRIDSGVDAATLSMLLASATDYIQGLTGRVLAAANYTITLDSLSPCQAIPLCPINSLTSVVANISDGTTVTLDPTAYTANIATTSPTISVLTVPNNTVSIILTVNAGYTAQASVPLSIQHAAAVLVAAGYDNRSALDPATTATVASLIAQYRRSFL